MKGKRIISGVLAVMTFFMSSAPAELPLSVAAVDEIADEAVLYTLGVSSDTDVVSIDEENFPDETFRSYVLNNFDNDGSGGLSQAEIEYVTEINVAGTEEQPGNVADLTGIGYFTALTNLFCEYNQLTSLDISSNTLLTKLWCNNNRLTELDVSHNKNLTDLVCGCNQLTSLDIGGNTSLGWLNCYSNKYYIGEIKDTYSLDSLPGSFDPAKASNWQGAVYDGSTNFLTNFTSDTVTYDYDCGNGYTVNFTLYTDPIPRYCVTFPTGITVYNDTLGNISSGDSIPSGEKLYIGMELNSYIDHRVTVNGEEITLYPNGDVYYCVDLYTLGSEDIEITLEKSEWSDERMSDYTVLNADEGVRVYWYNKYTGYIVNYPNSIKNGEYIPKGASICIRISSKLYPNMPKLYINGQFQASTLNSGNDWQVWGRYVPYADEFRISVDGMASEEPVAEINESTFPDSSFREMIISKYDLNKDNKLTENEILQASYLTVAGIDEEPGDIKSLKGIEYFTELVYLDCSNNKITSLDVSMFPKMYFLSCGNNEIGSLDVSKNPNLSQLYCSDNMLTEIDVTNNKYLERFACAANQITSLDLSKNTYLTWLYCSANKLTYLDLSNNTELETLGINENNLTSLDLSNNTKMKEYEDNDNSYEIAVTGNSFKLSELPAGFDPAKASNWQGAEYDSGSNSLINFTSDTVTYDYDCSNGHSIKFTLVKTGGNSINITVQPADTAVIEGLDASLSVKAEGTVTYQWQKASGDSWVDISGETSSVFALDNVTYDMNGAAYRCVIGDGSSSVTSDEAVITVKPAEQVTVSEVEAMSIDEVIKFVNAYCARYDKSGKDTAVLNEAQMNAIEKVLENDFKA